MRIALAPVLFTVCTIACNGLVGWGDLQEVNGPVGETDGGPSPKTDSGSSSSSSSGGAEAGPTGPRCNPSSDFQTPVPIGGDLINTVSAHEGSPTLTPDELTMIFQRSTSAAAGAFLISRRNSLTDAWKQPTELNEFVSIDTIASNPSIDGSALDIFFGELVGTQRAQIFHASRTTAQDQFASASAFDPVASSASDNDPFVTSDGAELFFVSNRADGDGHVYRSIRSPGGNYGNAQAVTELVGAAGTFEAGLAVSFDKLTIYFGSSRSPGSSSNVDIFMAHRPTTDDPFANVQHVASLSSSDNDIPGWLAQDNCVLYMTHLPNGPGDIYTATRGQ